MPRITAKAIFKLFFFFHFILGIHTTFYYSDGTGLYLPYNINTWIFISICIGLGIWNIHSKKVMKITKFSLSLCFGILLLLIPLFYGRSIPINLIYVRFIGLASIPMLYLSFLQLNLKKKDFYQLLFLIICSTLMKSISELGTQFLPSLFLTGKIGNYIFNTLNHRNILSTFLIYGIILPYFLISKSEDEVHFNSLKAKIFYLTSFFTSLCLILLQSKTAIISLPISIFLILITLKTFRTNLIILILTTILGLGAGQYIKENFSEKTRFVKRSSISNDNSFSVRIGLYDESFNLFFKKPFLGYGYGTFHKVFLEEHARSKLENPDGINLGSKNVLHPHNEFLFWLVEGGLITLVGFSVIVFSYIILLVRQKLKVILPIIGVIFPLFFHTQVEYPFYNSATHLFLFCFFIFFSDQELSKSISFGNSLSYLPKYLSIMIPAISIIFLLTVYQAGYWITKYEKTGNVKFLQNVFNKSTLRLKYDSYILKAYFEKAKEESNSRMLKRYIQRAEEILNYSPYIFLYYDIASAYQSLGNMGKAWELYNKGKYLYPDASWQDDIKN